MARISVSPTPIAGFYEMRSIPVLDQRGGFSRLFCSESLAEVHNERPILQINRSRTRHAGTVRGMHYQSPPVAEGKWIFALKGRVYDVGIDLRRGSPTFLAHHAVELDAARENAVFLPEGIAHGFQTLTDDCELLYLHTAPYAPDHEGGLRHDDPRLGIAWPLPVSNLSERDRCHAFLGEDFRGLEC